MTLSSCFYPPAPRYRDPLYDRGNYRTPPPPNDGRNVDAYGDEGDTGGGNRNDGNVPPPPPPTTTPGTPPRTTYPMAERTSNPNHVLSPYGPDHNVIDVSEFKSGDLAKDPSNGKIFRVP